LLRVELTVLGKANKVIATKDSTVIIGGKGNKKEIDARVAQLRKQKQASESKFDTEKIEERIAKLSGGVAVIHVGAATETEMKYLKLKIEDAVNATKAAIEEGIVAGGGTALVRAARKIRDMKTVGERSQEVSLGYEIVLKALEAPLRQIVMNTGKNDGSGMIEKIMESKSDSVGYSAVEDIFETDMIAKGIIDPVKVTRTALQNASSAGAILLTTEVAVAEEPKEEKPHAGQSPEMGY
jgi:chaperonin GroEL